MPNIRGTKVRRKVRAIKAEPKAGRFEIISKIILAILTPWTSKRLLMAIIGLAIINSLFWTSVYYLYSFPTEPQAGYFFKMFCVCIGASVTIVMWYLGIQTWGDDPLKGVSNAVNKLVTKNE